ncbi:MAG: phosphopentomutase [Latescibacteria bacterium DG_63]|nr:MAG: phosphopentomutase [Latescibacteria bacterium DG_63]
MRIIVIVLDGVGIGELPDAALYGDAGSDTLGNTCEAMGGLNLPALERLGLGSIASLKGVKAASSPEACYGKMAEKSPGKDSTSGHWELMGCVLDKPFPTYPEGFPQTLVREFESRTGRGVIGNMPYSGTEILKLLGDEHVKTGSLILYTSADSVFQLAAHEEVVPVEDLYACCRSARELLTGEHGVARVIARPFEGTRGNYKRTPRRKDFSLAPITDTILDILLRKGSKGSEVLSVGKVADLFAGRGFTREIRAKSNSEGMEALSAVVDDVEEGFVLANLGDFDTLWGHRNNPEAFGRGLEEFDRWLDSFLGKLGDDDVLFITADHGCDPTTPSTDHSREYVPLLVYGGLLLKGVNLGVRKSFADVGATVAQLMRVEGTGAGRGFAKEIGFDITR